MKTEIKVALITAGATILAALIGGIFLLLNSAHSPPTPLPPGSRPGVTVTPSGDNSTLAPSQTSTTPTATVAGGITGTWRGEWAVDSFGSSYADTLSLTQTDDSISGKGNAYYISSPTKTFSETISGSISGNLVSLTEHVNELHCFRVYTLTLSQDGKSLNGSYVGCGAYTVTVQFAKQ